MADNSSRYASAVSDGMARGQSDNHGGGGGGNGDQSQDQTEGQVQGQAEGQIQGQAELQAQGQGQAQFAYQESDNSNENGNGNGNLNGNGNGNLNGNLNANGNLNENFNTTTTTVDTTVSVDVEMTGVMAPPSETSLINLEGLTIEGLEGGMFVMPDFSIQTLNGDGNVFNLDQISSLVDNDFLSSPSVSLDIGGGGFGHPPDFSFNQSVSGNGGNASTAGDLGDFATNGNVSSANAVSAEAFTQHITQGANIQYNSMPVSVVGGDSFSEIGGTADGGGNA